MDKEIAAAIVLYYPNPKVLDYIVSITNQFGIIFIFDNTESEEQIKLHKQKLAHEKIKYVAHNHNKGLSYALNACCAAAEKRGYEWIMLFDQDSEIYDAYVDDMKKFVDEYDSNTVGMLVPEISDGTKRVRKCKKIVQKYITITSGMMLKLSAYRNAGPFARELFCDYVDLEYCLRLKECGYRILQNCEIILKHNVYDIAAKDIGYKINKYSPTRCYNKIWGYMYTIRKYSCEKEYIKYMSDLEWKQIKNIVLYDDDKMKKLKAMFKAIVDYYLKKRGKCERKL